MDERRKKVFFRSLTFGSVGTDDFCDLVSVFEEQESRHGSNRVLCGDITQIVDIDLDEIDFGKLLAEFHNLGSNDFTWSTPSRVKINDDEFARCDGRLEISGGSYLTIQSSLIPKPSSTTKKLEKETYLTILNTVVENVRDNGDVKSARRRMMGSKDRYTH